MQELLKKFPNLKVTLYKENNHAKPPTGELFKHFRQHSTIYPKPTEKHVWRFTEQPKATLTVFVTTAMTQNFEVLAQDRLMEQENILLQIPKPH